MAKRKRSRKRRGLSGLGAVTTKDFVAVAHILCRTGAKATTIMDIGDYFKSQNPRFDAARFANVAQCGKGKV